MENFTYFNKKVKIKTIQLKYQNIKIFSSLYFMFEMICLVY